MREEKEQLRGLCGTTQTEETREEMGLGGTHKRLTQHFLPLGDYKLQVHEDPCASVLKVRGNCRNPL